ncbi:MAG: IS30 family transposase [Minisyncoccia bacterium]
MHILIRKGYTQSEIADRIGVTQGAISYEINQKTRDDRLYDSEYSRHVTYVRKHHKRTRGNTIAEHPDLRKTVTEYLMDDQSPELLSGRLRKLHADIPYVSGRTIRKFIKSPYGRRIEAKRNKIHRRRGKRRLKFEITNKRMIDKRPKYIKDRKRIGDTEGDFIASGKTGLGMLLVVTDRKSRAPFLEKICPVSIRTMENGFRRIKRRFPELKTVTLDNDILFIHHKELERKFHIKIYFCHKHSPWEKPLVENRNKLIRRYIPKGSDISRYTRYYIQKLEAKLQRRIMKCLDYKLPKEILEEHRKRKKKP